MLRKLLLLTLLLVCAQVQAQPIGGVVENPEGKAIAKAQLTIINLRKSLVLWEGVSDSSGRFTLPAFEGDSMKLSVYHYDYDLYTRLLTTDDKDLKVVLSLASINASEVTVTGSANPIRFDKGDLVVNVEKMKNSERLSTAQLIRRIPGLYIEGSQVMYNNSPVVLYINGSKPTMPDKEVLKYIESLPADAVEELRLMPMPSNRYGDADAVIDIKLKSLRPDDFYSKTSMNGALLGDLFGGGVEEFLMFRKKNVTFNTNLMLDQNIRYSKGVDNNYFATPDIATVSPYETKEGITAINSMSNLTVDLKNKSKLDFNLFVYYDYHHSKRDWSYTENADPTQQYLGKLGGNDDMYSIAAKYSTDPEKDHSVSIYYSGMYGSLNSRGDYSLRDDEGLYNDYLNTDYSMRGHIHNLTVDGVSKFLKGKLQFKYGLYGDANFLKDDTDDYNISDGSLKNSSRLTATEFNMRAYARLEYEIGDNQGIALDLGYYQSIYNDEYSYTDESYQYSGSDGHFVPNLSYWLRTKNYRLGVEFETTVARPHYLDMLPGKRYVNNYSYKIGNPNLESVTRYRLHMGHTFWEFLSLDLHAILDQNATEGYMNVDPEGLIYSTRINVGNRFFYEADLNIPFITSDKKFYGSISGSVFGNYYYNIDPTLNIANENKFSVNGVVRTNLYYDITKRLSLEGEFSWRSKRETFQQVTGERFSLLAGVSYAFLKEKNLFVSFTAENFINSGLQRYETFSGVEGNYFINRSPKIPVFKLSVSYRINKGKEIDYRNSMGDFNRIMPK